MPVSVFTPGHAKRRAHPIMTNLRLFLLAALCAGCASCQSVSKVAPRKVVSLRSGSTISNVKTTAYTQSESDHIVYGAKSAVGNTLKFGAVRSAAADWSVYPVGTEFKIEGEPYVYQVDDYGSALVGTGTIDLYRPSKASMNQWGARNVNIKVIKWGSFDQSLAIMKPREGIKPHIRQMVSAIETRRPPDS
jgi:3D (Asp-Asp-Asp) domain-containing protein